MLTVRQKLAHTSSCFVSRYTASLSTSARQQQPEPLSTNYQSAHSDLQIHGRSWQPKSRILSKDIFQPVYAKLHQRIMSASNLKKYYECLSVATEMKDARVKPDLAVYNSLISTAADEAAWLDTWAIFDDMLSEGVRPDVVTINHLIRAQRFRSSHYLWKAIEKLVELGIKANAMTISHIIDRFVYDGNLEGALKYLLSAEHRGLVPEAKSAQKVIIMAAQQNHARLAVELAMWFEKNSVRKLDRVVWVHCLLSSAENLYSEGLSICWPIVRGLKINLNLGLVSVILNAAARHGLSDLAFDVLATMQLLGTPILEHNFAAVIEACCRDGKLKQALTLLADMRNQGLEPTERTTIPILNAIDHDINAVDETWAIIDQMHQEGSLVDISAFRVIIQASVSLGDLQRAMGTYKSLSDFGVTPDVSTYNVLLRGCVSAHHRQLGDVLVAEMGEFRVQPNQETFETMIHLSLSQEDYEDAFYFLEEMKSLSYVPSLNLYETLVRRCSLWNDPRVDTILDDMRQCGYRVSPELIRPAQKIDHPDSPDLLLDENARKFIETGGIRPPDDGDHSVVKS